MATSVQGEELRPWGYPLRWTSRMSCGSKCWWESILEGKALGNNTLWRTSRGRSGAGRGVLSHLVVYWGGLLLLSLHTDTLSRRSGTAGGFSCWRPVKRVQGLEEEAGGCLVEAPSSWGPPGWCFEGCLACFGLELVCSERRHWVWYLLTEALGEKSFGRAKPLLFAHSAIFSSVSVCKWTQKISE